MSRPAATATATARKRRRDGTAAESGLVDAAAPGRGDAIASSSPPVSPSPSLPFRRPRTLSLSPARPIRCRELHETLDMCLLWAFPERAIVEQMRAQRRGLLDRAVLRRLRHLAEETRAELEDQPLLEERLIRRVSHVVREILRYLREFLGWETASSGAPSAAAVDEIRLEAYTSGLEAIIMILQSSEQFRHCIVTEDNRGWDTILDLLRNHNVKLRTLCCQVLTLCFAKGRSGPVDTVAVAATAAPALSAPDRLWNVGYARRLAGAEAWAVVFDRDVADWGLKATRMTIRLLGQVCISVTHAAPVGTLSLRARDSMIALSDRFAAHAELLMDRIHAVADGFADLIAEKRRLSDEYPRIRARLEELIVAAATDGASGVDAGAFRALQAASQQLSVRSQALAARMDEYKADMARLL